MTIEEAIKHCEEVAKEQDKLCKQYDDASRYTRNHDKDIVSANAKKCLEYFECAKEHRQLAEWLKELKAYKEQSGDEELDFVPEHKKIPCTMIIGKPCEDAISRQAVLNAIYELCNTGETLKENLWRDNPHIDAVVEAIEELPSVSPQQRTGRWIPVGYDGYADGNPVYDWWECSECGWEHTGDEESLTAFCPNCGAKMEEVEE